MLEKVITVLKQLAVERFRFSCRGCGHAWSDEYDVQHIEDGHGVTWEYYSLGGVPVTAPTAPGSVDCPRCGASGVIHQLLAVREIPLADTTAGSGDADRPRQRVDAASEAPRTEAGLVAGRGAVSPEEDR